MYNAYITVTEDGEAFGRSRLEYLVDRTPALRDIPWLWVARHLRQPVLRIEAKYADDFRLAYRPALEAIANAGYQTTVEMNALGLEASGMKSAYRISRLRELLRPAAARPRGRAITGEENLGQRGRKAR